MDTNQGVWLEGQELRLTGEARNVSKSGMFIVAEGDAPEIGSEVQITFDDPDEGHIEVRMEVVWSSGNDRENAGLGLKALASDGQAAFERVVSRKLEEAGVEDAPEPIPSRDEEK